MNEEMGELLHKAEILEMDFLRENGVNPNYNDVENHIGKIVGMFEEEFEQNLEMNPAEIESASANLSDMKRLVQSMKKSDMKDSLMDCIERMEIDLC